VDRGGRPPGRDLTDVEERYLRFLMQIRERARAAVRDFDAELEDYVLQLTESGASTRGIGAVAGVGHTTVGGWAKNAKQRQAPGG
jgi:hypothetical protein